MKYLVRLSVKICLILFVSSCTVDSLEDTANEESTNSYSVVNNQSCDNQDPQSKLTNNGSVAFTFQIIDLNNNLIELVNVAPNTSTTWVSFPEGATVFNVTSNTTGVSDDKVFIDMSNCSEVEIVINSINKIDSPVINSL
ncbi:hypothetical protein DZC78_00895 [Olleya aquimaris]|uniref:hypothetical protein n=1 Tax=Olleya sp. ITB9 TaxID=1715648 RepID=UPI0006D1563C|nr:hypothetical protein [Olleya sp. ITB9]AXO78996.1 hypothetical protein DZC78_00895 [Olleya aquimaris]